MMAKEYGLIRRDVFKVGPNQVVVNETWDLTVPGCTIRRPYFENGLTRHPDNNYKLQRVLTDMQYRELVDRGANE